ncbi:MAG: flagellar biosynthetic protein FliR [Sphingomonadales bacterium]
MLGQILPAEIFGFLLVFARLGTMIMVMPALGESAIPGRVRLSIALAVSLAIYSVVRGAVPEVPGAPLGIFLAVITEILVGLFIGASARLIMSGLHVAGTVIAFQSGLAAAQSFDPTQGSQSAIIGTFMVLLGVVSVFTFDLHHMLLWAMRDSYNLFPVGSVPPAGDFSEMAASTVSNAFMLGIQIASPFLVYGLVFNMGLGLLARLMPQLQVFFVAMPLNILLAFAIMAIVIGAAMTWFVDYFENAISRFVL